MPFRKIAIRSSSFLGFAIAGVLAAGLAASPAPAATTTYDTNNTPYTGGTIAAGYTVLLNDGATVTGNITASGTLQFNQTGALTISNAISGTGTLSLTNRGALNLTSNSGAVAGSVALNLTTDVSSGWLQSRAGGGNLWVGGSGTGTLNVNGGLIVGNSGTGSNEYSVCARGAGSIMGLLPSVFCFPEPWERLRIECDPYTFHSFNYPLSNGSINTRRA